MKAIVDKRGDFRGIYYTWKIDGAAGVTCEPTHAAPTGPASFHILCLVLLFFSFSAVAVSTVSIQQLGRRVLTSQK